MSSSTSERTTTMSTEYKIVKTGKLVLKGEKVKKHKSKKRKREAEEPSSSGCEDMTIEDEADMKAHGGWWKTTQTHQVRGSVCIQMGSLPVYITALDDGLFTVGALHDEGDGPSPEEVLTVVPTGDSKTIALKSGYGKYVGVDSGGRLVGRAEAIGPREMWTPVYQDDHAALLSSTECFVGVDADDDGIVATSATAGPAQWLTIRCNGLREQDKQKEIPKEERGKLKDVELNYIKKFQKFQDKKTKVNPGDRVVLRDARADGRLHEALLDRRSKMKADRYCK